MQIFLLKQSFKDHQTVYPHILQCIDVNDDKTNNGSALFEAPLMMSKYALCHGPEKVQMFRFDKEVKSLQVVILRVTPATVCFASRALKINMHFTRY